MTSSVKPGQTTNNAPATTAQAFPVVGLMTLALAIFISMATEFLPGGLIPQIAAEFGRSSAEVGHLITVFALTVIVTAAPLAVITRRLPRKTMVLIAFGLIAAGNVGTALAPSFEVLLIARAGGALAHAAFWSVVAAYPAHMVQPTELGKATAVTAAGGSVAGVLGIPLGNALGQAFGWRIAFAALAGLALLALLLMVWRLPAAGATGAIKTKAVNSVGKDGTLPSILMVCLLIVLIVGAQSSFGTFNVVWLLDTVHLPPTAIPVMLFIGGAAGAVGVAVTGALYSRFPLRLFFVSLTALIGLLTALPLVAGSQPAVWVASGLIGAVFGGLPVMLQTRMMLVASPRNRNVAAALQVTAINIGIGGGALLGGIAISLSGLPSLPNWAAGSMGLALVTAMAWVTASNLKGTRKRLTTWR
ncbi:MFS transporter [Arthrobacter sp. Rue61a]|uniref:MFS transporter n=1 Tax=Arthrobacter sp. Rue61a TaxID=1118963 RepID=UPI00027DFD9F|nr:MFS transporter [Arthrobacter sp. Rue61a]AFR28759.1 sugar transporter [Arthrobacter sp. Rue61a]